MSKRTRVVWWLGHCLGLAALVTLPCLAHRAVQPEPFKLRIVQGPGADWSGQLKYLYLSESDLAGRYVFLGGIGASDEFREGVWQFDLQHEQITAKFEVQSQENESLRYWCWIIDKRPNEAIVSWGPRQRNYFRSLDWHSTFVRRCLFAWGLQVTGEADQIWRWDYRDQSMNLLEVVSGRIDLLRQRSPDGKWWITLADSHSKCCLHDGRTGLVKWQLPIHPIGPRGGSRSSGQLIWLPDSQSSLVFDDAEVRWFDVHPRTIRWQRSHAEFVRELLGSSADLFQDGLEACCVTPASHSRPMYETEHGIVRVPIEIVKNAQARLNHRPDEAVAFLWELPGNKWTPLGDGFAAGTVVDRPGKYRIDFQPDPDDSTRSNVVRTWLPTDGRKEMIAMNVASPTTARIVPNPDRLVWTTAACELWLLTLKAGESPRRLWPKSERAFAGE